MSQLKRVELEDGTVIMIEADENVAVPDVNILKYIELIILHCYFQHVTRRFFDKINASY